ncbi:MAG: redoxin family protein [Blastocatellia bacterium]|nr:redoxin family protein [Blastocatellia bacterium]
MPTSYQPSNFAAKLALSLLMILLTLPLLSVASAEADTTKNHSSYTHNLDNALVDANNNSVDLERLSNKKYLFVYFSAHWCGPCRAFSPELVKFYKDNFKNGDFEILFVSIDRDEDAMLNYMKELKMQWPAIKFGHKYGRELRIKYGIGGIPSLILLNENDDILASSFENGKYLGSHRALSTYKTLQKQK